MTLSGLFISPLSGPRKLTDATLFTCVIASLGGLLFGFDTAVVAGVTSALTAAFHLSPTALGLTVSSALWGTVVGALAAGQAADRYGRRKSLMILGFLYLVTALGCALAWDWWALLIFRTAGGLAIGASSVICPTYIAEIAPARYRGRLVALFQINVVAGILVAYVSNFLVSSVFPGDSEWRVKFAASAAPALVFYVALFRIPESPRWFVRQGLPAQALLAAQRLDFKQSSPELEEILHPPASEQSSEKLFQKRFRTPILLAFAVAAFNQLAGVNAILYYLNSIFAEAGFSSVSSDLQSIIIGLTNLVGVFAAMPVIDRVGRRILLLIGSVGTTICLLGVALIYQLRTHQGALLWCLVGFIGFFSFSQGAVVWVYVSEIFPNSVRAKGLSLGSSTHWFLNAAIALVFPVVAARSHSVPFFFFASMTALQFLVVVVFFPETRGVPLEEMESRLYPRSLIVRDK